MPLTKPILRSLSTLLLVCGIWLQSEAAAQYKRPPKLKIDRSNQPTKQRMMAMEQFLAIVTELDTLLKGVKNKADADKAAGALVDIHQKIMKLNAAIINQPMNLQEFNAVNRTYGSRVNSEFAKLEKTMRQLKSSNFHKSKALAYALVYGMSHPYYNGRRLDGEPILNAYYGDMDNAEYKRAAEAANRQRAMRSSVPRPIMKQYQEAFDADSGRSSSEFTFHP